MESKNYGKLLVSFLGSLAFCLFIVIMLILFRTETGPWYTYPQNIALIIASVALSVLFAKVIHSRAELKDMMEYFKNTSVKDALSGVYNRRYIDENIDNLIKSVSRSNGAISLMIIDLDFFRKYNEMYGHGKGDNCLKNTAKLLTQTLKRDNDIVARYGGKEFLAILPNTDENGARQIADKFLKNVRDFNIPFEKSEISDRVTVSIGVVSGGKNFSLAGEEYIKKAGEALAASKQNGCNRYTLYSI